jgi:hypothetical protein
MQMENLIASISQPSGNFSRLKWAVPQAKIAIEQFCNFLNRARSLDLIQRPSDALVEPPARAHVVAHRR